MKKHIFFIMLLAFATGLQAKGVKNPKAITALAERVCGKEALRHVTFMLEDRTATDEKDVFQLGGKADAVTVSGNSINALACGLNWYLGHEAGVCITWNNLRQAPSSYPAPKDTSMHTCTAAYRYALNYCTFSYSMSFWDWERWEKELDWMALHGINLPLMAVGVDAVWRGVISQLGYGKDVADRFIAGPAHQGWWLMNNLQGHGGPNPEWWYVRQARLAKKIVARMRELGMEPVVPGFVGMVPDEYADASEAGCYTGAWCGFPSPKILKPGSDFDRIAGIYYAQLRKIMGNVRFFSMDPVHERNYPGGMDDNSYAQLVQSAWAQMDKARCAWTRKKDSDAVWVAQMWQQNADAPRIACLDKERALLLDLASERVSYVGNFDERPFLFCMLHNYGGNIGMYGCAQQLIDRYYSFIGQHRNMKGIGTTPEGIETNPVMYELMYELPWHGDTVTAKGFFSDYACRRYGMQEPDKHAVSAWRMLLGSVYNDNDTQQQGCREPVFCARPNLDGATASSWAFAGFDWPAWMTEQAARLLLQAGCTAGANYEYDVVDVVRQALSDHGHELQAAMARTMQDEGHASPRFKAQCDSFLVLIDDIDRLLGTVEDFRLGRWTAMARNIAIANGHPEDADWLERNARMLITTWADNDAATNRGGLRDYANREYSGLMADYYRPRWKQYFDNLRATGESNTNWFTAIELPFVNGESVPYGHYTAARQGNPVETARQLMDKYFPSAATRKPAPNGEPWPDTDGKHINAHGGMVMKIGGLWYWWGEDRPDRGFTTEVGVSVYTSPDLEHWTRKGTALAVSEEEGSDIERGCIMERPKVLYCPGTGKYVMLFHLELKGRGYEAARVGFAVSDTPEGPYTFVRSLRPNAGVWPMDYTQGMIAEAQALDENEYKEWWTPEWRDAVTKGLLLSRDVPGGQMSRDMTVYVDDDGTAYHIFSAEENLTINLAELTPDCLGYTGRYIRIAPGGQNEAPALMKHDGTYWMITSGCTGWAPNRARMFHAESLWGPWTQAELPSDTPFVGQGAGNTFGGQGTYIFHDGSQFVFMADVWNPRHLSQSRHLWLPISFDSKGYPVIRWAE